MSVPVSPLPEIDLEHVLTHTRDLWTDWAEARIFMTGGTGFFGFWLLESFCHAVDRLGLSAQATVLTRAPAAFALKAPHLAAHPALSFVTGDVRDFVFPVGRFDLVVHAATAASAQLNEQQPALMLETILQGTRRVWQFAETCRPNGLLLTSSGAVYGPQPANLSHMPEHYSGGPDPLNAASAYGEGKRTAELMSIIEGARIGCRVSVARCFAFHGPHLPLEAHFAIGNFLRDTLNGGSIRVGGDGTPVRSYLYAADLAVWLWTLLANGAAGRAYNVGSSEAISIAETAAVVASVGGGKVEVARKPTPGCLPKRYVPAVQRATTELGLHQHIGLEEGIRRTLDWLRKDMAPPSR